MHPIPGTLGQSGVLAEQEGDGVRIFQVLGLREAGHLRGEATAVLGGAGEALHQLDDVGEVEGLAVVSRHADQQGLGERQVGGRLAASRTAA